MRRALFVFPALLALAAPAFAQEPRFNLVISKVSVGFPGGMETDGEPTPLFRAGSWAPVYVEIKAEMPGFQGTEGNIDVTVTAPDPDDVATNYTTRATLPPLAANRTHTVVTYTKVAGYNPDISVTLHVAPTDAPLGSGPTIGAPFKRSFTGIDPGRFLCLTLGGRLPGLREALRSQVEGRPDPPAEVAYLDRVDQLPTNWFAYEGVDVVLLGSSNKTFREALTNRSATPYRQALLDWVERGGQLVVFAGRDASDLGAVPEFQRLLPVNFNGLTQLKSAVSEWADPKDERPTLGATPQLPLDVARLVKKEGRSFQTILHDVGTDQPLIVQGAFGFGRVTVAAFDADLKPVAAWEKEKEFWPVFLKQTGVRLPTSDPENGNNNFNPYGNNYGSQELLGQLQNYLENFDDVPVIPFGWVALFIVVYIIVVGPLDYFFLKKVVKRLELTWITFPTVVLLVSVAAYFTAYQLKGKDLRIRKVDVVDVDLRSRQVVGRTWFTLFSPRIQHYTLGVEPAVADWAAKNEPVEVSWMNRPEIGGPGMRGPRRQSLFRRSYDYEADAVGLKGVPIQVWSTKSFTATWQGTLAELSLVTAKLDRAEGTPLGVTGEITWRPGHSGMELKDAFLICRNNVYSIALEPGKPFKLDAVGRVGEDLPTWVQPTRDNAQDQFDYRGRYRQVTNANLDETLRGLLFHRARRGQQPLQNGSLRPLDQTWRTAQDQREEVVLVARLKELRGDAETVTQNPVSPSHLWLGGLPSDEKPREPLVGLMLQETFVRVFIPIQQ